MFRSNDWSVDFFAIEMGARSYSAESLLFCLKSLGFKNKTIKAALNKLSMTAIPSFVIWLSKEDNLGSLHSGKSRMIVQKNRSPSKLVCKLYCSVVECFLQI